MSRTLCLALAFAVLLLVPASLRAEDLLRDALTGKTQAEQEDTAASTKNPVNPRDSAPFPGPVVKQPSQGVTASNTVDAIKKAAEAQGNISPLTVKALQHDPKAMEAVGRTPSDPASGGSRGAGSKSSKAMYGDIIIHK